MSKNDIYDISGRVKNYIAMEDIALSPVGTILVNYFSLMFKDLYDFADCLPELDKNALDSILESQEVTPMLIIKASTPKEQEYKSLYQQLLDSGVKYESNKEALDRFVCQYDALGEKHGMTGDDFWVQAENSKYLTEDHKEIMRLSRGIQMLNYLVKKEKK